MKGYTHKKGFKIIEMSPKEARLIGFGLPKGCLCMHCNEVIKDTVYYIAVLNDVMDKECADEYLSRATYYPEDSHYENKYYNYYMGLLNILNSL